ncbi:MAG: hypothetical protein EA398_02220 [Deltaproteobacteria bacterium]|nr:MAG: hypothetical protein EA398_02220 [Deltaproteobacteria bacterium]
MAGQPDYVRTVAEYFLERRGRGTALSSMDMHQVGAWERDGVPVDAVFRGIDRAFGRRREPPSSLRECAAHVGAVVREDRGAFGGTTKAPVFPGVPANPPAVSCDAPPTGWSLEQDVLSRLQEIGADSARPRPVRRASARLEAEVRELLEDEGRLSAETALLLDDAFLALLLEESSASVRRRAESTGARAAVEAAHGEVPRLVAPAEEQQDGRRTRRPS